MTALYSLKVIAVEEVDWNPGWRYREIPSLYLDIWHGGNKPTRTCVKQSTLNPKWNEVLHLTASVSPNSKLFVQLKHETLIPICKDPVVGVHDIRLSDLIQRRGRSNDDEVHLVLRHPPQKGIATPAGILTVQLSVRSKDVDIKASLDQATEYIKPIVPPGYIAEGISQMHQLAGQKDLYQFFADVVQKIGFMKKVVQEVSKIHPYLTAAYQICDLLLKPVLKQLEEDNAVIKLVKMMKESYAFASDSKSIRMKAIKVESTVIRLLVQTSACCHFIHDYSRPHFWERMLHFGTSDKIDEFAQVFTQLQEALRSDLDLHVAIVVADMSYKVDLIHLKLRLNPYLVMNTSHGLCKDGFLMTEVTTIIDWASSETKQNILWLYGDTGSGKSTVAKTIAHDRRNISCLGAYLCFDHQNENETPPIALIRTIAYKLAETNVSIARYIDAAVTKVQDVVSEPLENQFEHLLLEPLTAAVKDLYGPLVIVVDALDACGTSQSRTDPKGNLMHLLEKEFVKLPSQYRILITSRPEDDIKDAFTHSPNIKVLGLKCDERGTTEMHSLHPSETPVPAGKVHRVLAKAETAFKSALQGDHHMETMLPCVLNPKLYGGCSFDEALTQGPVHIL